MKPEVNNQVLVLKMVKVLLNENTRAVQNVNTLYKIAKLFNMPNLTGTAFRFRERCFNTVVQTQSFLELDFTLVAKIISTCGLQITSEGQVLDAGDAWSSYNQAEHSKFNF